MSTTVYVFTLNGGRGKWSVYSYPFSVDAFAQLGNDLYIRNGDIVSKVVEGLNTDDVAGVPTNFPGVVQWGWLDFGGAGVTKMVEGFDYVGTGQGPSLSVGYDQRNIAAFTAGYQLANDTMPGGIIPFPISAPTMSVKLDYVGGAAWSMKEVVVFLDDDSKGSP